MESFIGSKGVPPTASRVKVRAGGRTQRILIVEDHADSARSLCLISQIWGYDACVASTGDEAIDLARDFKPDVVLLDLGLPDIDGYTVARAMRGDPWLKTSKLLAMTGHDGEETRRKVVEAGFDRHLVKPLGLDALERLLAHLATTLA